jgi:hypothetical protein
VCVASRFLSDALKSPGSGAIALCEIDRGRGGAPGSADRTVLRSQDAAPL